MWCIFCMCFSYRFVREGLQHKCFMTSAHLGMQGWKSASTLLRAVRWRVNSAHVPQSRPNSGLDFQVKVLKTIQVFPPRSKALIACLQVPSARRSKSGSVGKSVLDTVYSKCVSDTACVGKYVLDSVYVLLKVLKHPVLSIYSIWSEGGCKR